MRPASTRPASRRPARRAARSGQASPPAPPSSSRTSDTVLDVAERLIQIRGFQGVSYADIAAEVGVTTASLHYHFPSKADLGLALVERYRARFTAALEVIERREPSAIGRLAGCARIYLDVLDAGRMCLCGMLAAEHSTLPAPMRRGVRAFFDAEDRWVAGVLDRGRKHGELAFTGTPGDAARLWTSSLEGALLLAKACGDRTRLAVAIGRLLAELAR